MGLVDTFSAVESIKLWVLWRAHREKPESSSKLSPLARRLLQLLLTLIAAVVDRTVLSAEDLLE